MNKMYEKKSFLCPIYPIEIERYKKHLRIGQKKKIPVREYDENFCLRDREETCVVVRKYKHIFAAQNRAGKMRMAQYVDMVIRERQRRE